jgi:hypothetical protein
MSKSVLRLRGKMFLSLLIVVVVGTASAVYAKDHGTDSSENSQEETKSQPGPLNRIILLKFEDGLSPEKIKELTDGIVQLKHKIPAVASLNVFPNTNTDRNYYVSKGFTHVVLVTFRNADDRAAFLASPIHKAYETKILVPRLKDFLVVEYNVPPVL